MGEENAENLLPRKLKLLGRAREVLRAKYCGRRTEEAYIGWMRRFILFHGKRRPRDMGVHRS